MGFSQEVGHKQAADWVVKLVADVHARRAEGTPTPVTELVDIESTMEEYRRRRTKAMLYDFAYCFHSHLISLQCYRHPAGIGTRIERYLVIRLGLLEDTPPAHHPQLGASFSPPGATVCFPPPAPVPTFPRGPSALCLASPASRPPLAAREPTAIL